MILYNWFNLYVVNSLIYMYSLVGYNFFFSLQKCLDESGFDINATKWEKDTSKKKKKCTLFQLPALKDTSPPKK